jgi:16S rRNA (guanine966-N2)-methyltransferase
LLRIVAGRLGGRRLVAPRDSATRPTAERVREALFSVLGPAEGAVLDLYAGSGALGFEALSRGAGRVVLVEARKPAIEAIRENIQALGVGGQCELIPRPVERAGPQLATSGPFRWILADPPYTLVENGQAPRAVLSLLAAGLLAPAGVLVLEHDARTEPPAFPGISLLETRRYGATGLSLFEAPA